MSTNNLLTLPVNTAAPDPTVQAQVEAAQGGRQIPIGGISMAPTVESRAPSNVEFFKRLPWMHIAGALLVGLIVWWLVSGENPVKVATEAASDATKAVTG